MSGSSVSCVAVVAITMSLGACKFAALPDLSEDGATIDAAIDAPIDGPVDAPNDASGRAGPLVQNGQLSEFVLGQQGFATNSDPGVTARSFRPASLAFDAGRLWMVDSQRNRVLGWDLPTFTNAPATHLLGQTSFTDGALAPISASTLSEPRTISAAGGHLVVTDFSHNRALLWNQVPSTLGAAADVVLGQVDFVSTAIGFGPSQMRWPVVSWSDGDRVVVAGGWLASTTNSHQRQLHLPIQVVG